jgi:hypothetical protein
MSPDSQIVPLTVALVAMSFIIIGAGFGMLYFAFRFTERAEQSISAHEAGVHAEETVKVEAPQPDHKAVWINQETFHVLPAFHWPQLQITERRKITPHSNVATSIGSSQNSY